MQARTLITAIAALCALAVAPVQGQTTNRPSKQTGREHRVLLIVETSKTMSKRSEGIEQAVKDLVGSGLQGQLKRGDALGLWTFNEGLITGKFPVKQFDPGTQSTVANEIIEFLKQQKYEKQGAPGKVLPTLGRVITNSPLITVLLISSGNTDLHGTGFDDKINEVYHQWRDQQNQKKLPFVTLFRGHRGALTACSASPAQWPIDVPSLPPAPIVQAMPEGAGTNLHAATTKKPVATLPPLIISGKKPEPQPAPKPTEAVTNSSPAMAVEVAKSATNSAAELLRNTASSESARPETTAAPVQAAAAPLKETEPAAKAVAGTPPPAQTPSTTAEPASKTTGASAAGSPAGPVVAAETKASPAAAEVGLAPQTPEATAAEPGQQPTTVAAMIHGVSTRTLLLGAVCIASILLLALVVPRAVRHRARHAGQVSLITRSLDRTTR